MRAQDFEFIIHDKPNRALFNQYIDRIIKDFNGHLLVRMEDLDIIYCDFSIQSETLTLHQDTYLGISIYPQQMKDANPNARDLALKIFYRLRYPIEHEQTWVLFENGREDEINYLLDIIIELRKIKGSASKKILLENSPSPNSCRICGSEITGKYMDFIHYSVCQKCDNKFIKSKNFEDILDSMPKTIKFVG